MKKEFLLAVFTGTISAIITVASMRVDIDWLKMTAQAHDTRLTHLERKVLQ